MHAIIKRLKSKTYWAAIIGAALTILDTKAQIFANIVPTEYSGYIIMLWPLLMITLREITTTSLSEK